jgi:hypothetical protein
MTTQTMILAGVFVYFGIGATIAGGVTAMSYGFTGRFEPMAIAIFFAWPFLWLWRNGVALIFVIGIGAAALMTWLAYLLLQHS